MGEKQQVSLEDVARYCGLSTVTVSRVLNHSPSVREYNRQKVMEAIEALGYIPNAAARTLARGTTGIIGMITPGLQDPFFSQIVQEVNNGLISHNLFLAISITANQGCDYILQQQRVDGMMLLARMSSSPGSRARRCHLWCWTARTGTRITAVFSWTISTAAIRWAGISLTWGTGASVLSAAPGS